VVLRKDHTRRHFSTILVIDPLEVDGAVFSTSGMAEDVIVLLDFVGWTEERSLHIVGVSLGGMIAQGLW
jgi:hypothetical protein